MIENLIGETHRPGRVEVVCGSMFSGKTEELIRRLKRAKIARQQVMIFKPAIDTRYSEVKVVSHDHNCINSTPVKDTQTILKEAQGYDVIGIDEAQFFDDSLGGLQPIGLQWCARHRGGSRHGLSRPAFRSDAEAPRYRR